MIKLFSTLLIPLFASITCIAQYDIVIQNGKIIDGTGNSWFYGDVGIKNDKIIYVGKIKETTGAIIISANGLIVAPGFIDVHGHIETGIMERPTADNYIYDGVTTVVTGNCGNSADDLKLFFRSVDTIRPSINVASLVGHNTVRRQVMGLDDRKATADEQSRMEALVAKAMKDGAVGISTGLIYLPGMYSNTQEIVGLAKAAVAYDGLYASHIRNEENEVVEAINEAIQIGKEAHIPVQISHFKVSARANWGRSNETLPLIENARRQGYDVTIDQYPYTASSTNLGIRLPDWALAGGQDSLVQRIKDTKLHKKIVEGMLEQLHSYKYKNYSFAVVANHTPNPSYNGKSITEINKSLGRKPGKQQEAETILDIMKAGGAQMVYHGMSENDVQAFIKYPYNMVGADAGVPIPFKSIPHPRAYGTNARVLAKYVREEKLITLEEAIRRMTSLAAQKFKLKDRGLLKEGMSADIVVFNENEVTDKATYEKPHQYSIGFKYVLVNGVMVIDDGKHTGSRPGRSLMGPGKE